MAQWSPDSMQFAVFAFRRLNTRSIQHPSSLFYATCHLFIHTRVQHYHGSHDRTNCWWYNLVSLRYGIHVSSFSLFARTCAVSCLHSCAGTGFLPAFTVGFRCIFHEVASVPATALSQNVAVCFTPESLAARHVAVSLRLDGSDLGSVGQFAFIVQPNVLAASPRSGPLDGGTVVHISGSFSNSMSPTFCRIGTMYSPGYVLSRSQLRCTVPRSARTGAEPFELVQGISGVSLFLSTFVYDHAARVASLVPNVGPSEGGTAVIVNGESFSRRAAELNVLLIKFNATNVPVVQYISSSAVACISPSNEPGAVSVEATNNLQQFTESGASFSFFSVSLFEISPSAGPVHGGTMVLLRTSSAAFAIDRVMCKFGSSVSPGSYGAHGSLACFAPSSRRAGSVVLTVSDTAAAFQGRASFVYQAEPHLDRVYPAMGPQVCMTRDGRLARASFN